MCRHPSEWTGNRQTRWYRRCLSHLSLMIGQMRFLYPAETKKLHGRRRSRRRTWASKDAAPQERMDPHEKAADFPRNPVGCPVRMLRRLCRTRSGGHYPNGGQRCLHRHAGRLHRPDAGTGLQRGRHDLRLPQCPGGYEQPGCHLPGRSGIRRGLRGDHCHASGSGLPEHGKRHSPVLHFRQQSRGRRPDYRHGAPGQECHRHQQCHPGGRNVQAFR